MNSKDDTLSSTQIRKFLRVPYTRLYAWWRRGHGPEFTGEDTETAPDKDGRTIWYSTPTEIDTWLARHWLGLPDERQETWQIIPYSTMLSSLDMGRANNLSERSFRKLLKLVRNPLAYVICRTYLFDPRDAMAWSGAIAQIKLSLGYDIDSKLED